MTILDLSGGVGSRKAGGGFWNGFGMGVISSGLNHAFHALQEDLAEWFGSKKEAYDYAVAEGYIADNLKREVSGWGLENGEYLVLDASENTPNKSHNNGLRMRFKGDVLQVRFNGRWHNVKSHFHLHWDLGKGIYDPIGISDADLNLKSGKFRHINMNVLYKGNEYLLNLSNQYYNSGVDIGYSLQNLGSWNN
jgi:hypothetical protein